MKGIRKLLRGCWHLMWACVPGCGQMCQGYMKRGISQTIIFCALVFIAIFLEAGVLSVLAFPLWAYSFFDSYNLRRQLREGLTPEDEFMFGMSEMDSRRLSRILSRRGGLIGWLLVAVGLYSLYMVLARGVFGALSDLFPWLDWLYRMMVWDAPRILGTVLIVALGIWFIKGPKAPKDSGFDDDPPYAPPRREAPPKMEPSPWTEVQGQFHQEAEPKAPEVPQVEKPAEPAPVVLEWKSEFNVEKYEQELQEKDHDGQ